MEYQWCRIGQLDRCNSTGCEWKKVFQGYCNLIPTNVEINFRKSREKVAEEKSFKQVKVQNFELLNESKNEFKIVSQDDWINKIKVKL